MRMHQALGSGDGDDEDEDDENSLDAPRMGGAESTAKSTTDSLSTTRLATSPQVHGRNDHSTHSKAPLLDGASEGRSGAIDRLLLPLSVHFSYCRYVCAACVSVFYSYAEQVAPP